MLKIVLLALVSGAVLLEACMPCDLVHGCSARIRHRHRTHGRRNSQSGSGGNSGSTVSGGANGDNISATNSSVAISRLSNTNNVTIEGGGGTSSGVTCPYTCSQSDVALNQPVTGTTAATGTLTVVPFTTPLQTLTQTNGCPIIALQCPAPTNGATQAIFAEPAGSNSFQAVTGSAAAAQNIAIQCVGNAQWTIVGSALTTPIADATCASGTFTSAVPTGTGTITSSGGLLDTVGNLVGSLTNGQTGLGGTVSGLTGTVGGLTGGTSGLTSGLTNTVGGLTGGGTSGLTSGLTDTVGGLTGGTGTGGLTSGLTDTVGGLTGGTGTGGLTSGLTNTAGGLLGGLELKTIAGLMGR